MFPSILSLGVANVAGIDEESITTSELLEPLSIPYNRVKHEQQSESLLSVLDDKNKIISSLKKQLQNQKMQLTYYMNRGLSQNTIEKLSESCSPGALEESLPLNLALNQFCKQTGIKTKLLSLYERMNRLELNISNSLRDQEFIIRKIVNKLCEFVKIQDMSRSDFKHRFASFITDPLHVNLFDRLLTATLRLRRKLDGFKICCERVLIVEEERNAIVDQVYSLPVEERINCNYLVRIQMEKAELENEIKRISQHQATGRHRIKELNVIEKILHNLQWELNSSFLKNEESCISKMLKKINSEAQVLLQITKEQRRKFECELSKTKCPEPDRVLFFINLASEIDKFEKKDFDRYEIKSEEEIRFLELIKVEIDLIKKKTKEEAEKNVKKIRNECEFLRQRVTEVAIDNSRTKIANQSLRTELDELKLEHTNAVQRLKQERDLYKSQVEDLQAIREAYAQLVDKQPSTTEVERDFLQQIGQRDNRIQEVEKFLKAQKEEIEGLKSNIADQNDQISVLNRFINLARTHTPMNEQPSTDPKFSCESCSIISRTETKFDSNSESEECDYKSTKASIDKDPVFPRNRRSATKKSNGSSKSSKQPKNRMKNSLETLSDEESLCLLNMFLPDSNSSSKNSIMQTANSQSAELRKRVKTSKSSIFSMELKSKNSELEHGLSEEHETLKDVSAESLLSENVNVIPLIFN